MLQLANGFGSVSNGIDTDGLKIVHRCWSAEIFWWKVKLGDEFSLHIWPSFAKFGVETSILWEGKIAFLESADPPIPRPGEKPCNERRKWPVCMMFIYFHQDPMRV